MPLPVKGLFVGYTTC